MAGGTSANTRLATMLDARRKATAFADTRDRPRTVT